MRLHVWPVRRDDVREVTTAAEELTNRLAGPATRRLKVGFVPAKTANVRDDDPEPNG